MREGSQVRRWRTEDDCNCTGRVSGVIVCTSVVVGRQVSDDLQWMNTPCTCGKTG